MLKKLISKTQNISILGLTLMLGNFYVSSAATLNVRVEDGHGNLVPGATIYAINFGNQGPNPTNSVVMADGNDGDGANGIVQLTLNSNFPYDIYADLQNSGPTTTIQMSDEVRPHPHVFMDAPADGSSVTVILDQPYTDRGAITAHVTNATHAKGIFGNVRKVSTGDDMAFGACVASVGTACDVVFHNIPTSISLNTYDVSAFDPSANSGQGKGNGGQLNSVVQLNPANPPASISIDIANGLPPDLSANSGNNNQTGPTSSAELEGVVEDFADATKTIPWGGINLRVLDSNGNKFDRYGTGVDQNGRFKLMGLDVGTTYYVRAMGGCIPGGACYDGYESSSEVMGINDFLYLTADPVSIQMGVTGLTKTVLHVRLHQAQPGQFSIPVFVRDNTDRLLPGSNVNLWTDGYNWHHSADPKLPYAGTPICDGNPFHAVDISSPGFANLNVQAATGYALLSGLRPGNYSLGAWTQFGNNKQISFNGGADNRFEWGGPGINNHRGCYSSSNPQDPWTSADDLRLTIEQSGAINVYDTSGTLVMENVSSITIRSPIPTGQTATLAGTLTFPRVVDLRTEPISIMLTSCGEGGCQGNFDIIGDTETPAASYGYVIHVAAEDGMSNPLTYWMQIISNYWGVIQEGDGQNQITFNGTNLVIKNFRFARAGRATGKVLKPDGSTFIPGQQANGGYLSANINANGLNNHSWGNAQVNQDGSFSIGGLLPGEYALQPQVNGGDVSYSPAEPASHIMINAGADSYKDVQFVSGEIVQVKMDTNTLPSLLTLYDSSNINGERWEAQRFTFGTKFTQDILGRILNHSGGDDTSRFQDVPAGNSTPCNGTWSGGFCPQRTPSNAAYDFYMYRMSDVGNQATTYAYFTIVGSSKNVVVDAAHKTPPALVTNQGTIPTLIHVDFAPVGLTNGGIVRGHVKAEHFFRKADFDALGGSFDNFIKFIPMISLTDGSGQLIAAGMVTPSPAYINLHNNEFEADVARGDTIEAYRIFMDLLNGDQWGYEIRGVPTGKTYNLIATTPNYPQVSKTVAPIEGQTSTVNIDFDAEVGQGATMKGVVKSTSGVIIQGATVAIGSRAIKDKTLTTDESGDFMTEGLPKGAYKVEVTADGYAPSAQEVNVVAASTYTVDFTQASGFGLVSAPGVITGTVREITFTRQGPVVRPVSGATVFAFDDTYNGNNPDKPLCLYKVFTSSDGVYTLKGLIPLEWYKISVWAPGRYVAVSTVAATNGILTNVDFMLKKKGLQVRLFARPNAPNFEFGILNASNFDTGRVWYEDAAGGFDKAAATEITNTFQEVPNVGLVGKILLTDLDTTKSYILHIEAIPANGAPMVTKEITFSLHTNGSTDQPVEDQLIGDDTTDDSGHKNNEVTMDSSGGSGTSLEIPAGSLLESNSNPTIVMSQADQNSLSSGQLGLVGSQSTPPTLYGDIFNVNFNDVQFTERKVIFNLPFKVQSVGGNIANLQVLHFKGGQWVPVVGQITVDPVTGVVSIQVNGQTQIAGQAPLGIASTGNSKEASTMAATFDGHRHSINANASSSGSGSFVVGMLASTGVVTTGYKQYNVPNPFNLETKTLTLSNGAGNNVNATIKGTYIVFSPTSSGDATVRIYNVAGDMVREIKETVTGGTYNYINWDGRNTAGEKVASGVYFASVDAPGSNKKKPIKMVVVK